MDNTTTVESVAAETVPAIAERELIRAATNSPALASDQFELGSRVFPIVDLPYDDYIEFLSHLQPVIETLVSRVVDRAGLSIPGIDLSLDAFSPTALIKLCAKTLPEMVCIMCRQSDATVTVEQIKLLAKKPTALAIAVIKQVKQNRMIADFADFFGQLMPLIQDGLPTPSTADTTP